MTDARALRDGQQVKVTFTGTVRTILGRPYVEDDDGTVLVTAQALPHGDITVIQPPAPPPPSLWSPEQEVRPEQVTDVVRDVLGPLAPPRGLKF